MIWSKAYMVISSRRLYPSLTNYLRLISFSFTLKNLFNKRKLDSLFYEKVDYNGLCKNQLLFKMDKEMFGHVASNVPSFTSDIVG